jgi:uncharacterized membrane protein
MMYLYGLTLLWNLGSRFDMTQVLIPAVAALFYAVGAMIQHARQNWFIGIRTPWTLMNETVWEKTHQMGGRLFKLAALISLVGVLFPDLGIWFILVPVLGVALYTIVYSYFAYQAVVR